MGLHCSSRSSLIFHKLISSVLHISQPSCVFGMKHFIRYCRIDKILHFLYLLKMKNLKKILLLPCISTSHQKQDYFDSNTTTSTATNHLNKLANSSQRSIQIAEKKIILLNEVQGVIKSNQFLTDQMRTKGIILVKNFVTMHFVPFDFLQHQDIRSGMAIMGNGGVDTTVPYEMLHPKNT